MKYAELRGKRLAAGIRRQSALAEEFGCATETIADIELGRIGVDPETVDELDAAIARLTEAPLREKVVAGAGASR